MIVAVVIANKPEKNFGTSTGFKPMAFALALQCMFYHLSYEDPLIGSRPVRRVHSMSISTTSSLRCLRRLQTANLIPLLGYSGELIRTKYVYLLFWPFENSIYIF